LSAQAEEKDPTACLVLDLQGITCIGCVWLIEQVFERKPGAIAIQINSALGQVRILWNPGEFDMVAFARELQSYGYLLAPAAKRENRESRQLVHRMGLTAALAMNCMLFTVPFYFGMDDTFEYAKLFGLLTFLFATMSVAVGGSYFIKRSWQSLRHGFIHIDLPIALGIVIAYAGSVYAWIHADHSFVYFDFVSMFTFLMLVGRWTQQIAIEKNRNYLLSLRNQEQQVRLVTDEAPGTPPRKMPASEVRAGTRYAIEPGKFVPVRSELLSARGSFGMDWINGESDAHEARRGSPVLSGAIHIGNGEIQLLAKEDWANSLLSRLLALDTKEAPRHSLLERIIKFYLCAVILIAVVGGGAWYMATGHSFTALQVLISVLVVSCPCAIGIAWPLTDELAVSVLRKQGVFVRNQNLWHRLAGVRKIIFDKTGTLTMENLALRNPESIHRMDHHTRSILLHLIEGNLHPVSRCLREFMLAEGMDAGRELLVDLPVNEVVGFGLEVSTSEGLWRLGRPGWEERLDPRNTAGKAYDCQLSLNGRLLATFELAEEIRADAAAEISTWRSKGFQVYILSGDRKEKVAAMTEKLGLPPENGIGEMSPSDKADWVRKIDRQDTLMIGDGANDSLAFDSTWCKGTPAVDRGVLEQKADFYFLGRGLSGIRNLFETARNRRLTLKRVFTFTIAYNLFAIILCLSGLMNPLVAAVIMPLSAIISISSVVVQTKARQRNVR
ncbi:MAG: heavy metal translocating P-type ATPase, partial [Opitutales bacterium]